MKIFRDNPCPRFFIKTAGYRRLIKKPSVRIGFSFYALIFTDFSAIPLGNLVVMFVFIKKLVYNVLEHVLQKSLKLIVIGSNTTNDYFL